MKKIFLSTLLAFTMFFFSFSVSNAENHPAPGTWYTSCYVEQYWAWVGWPQLWERRTREVCEMKFY